MCKLLCSLFCFGALLLGAFRSNDEVAAPTREAALRGAYVEARTANVFVGACHFQGEYDTRGREAVLAWSIAEGERDGVSLAGLAVVAAVAGDANLAEASARRTSVVYVPAGASAAQRDALVAWLRAEHGAALGEIAAVRVADVAVERDGDRFHVRAGEAVELAGSALPDRACCTMPFEVWYAPFASVASPIVGEVERFRSTEPALAVRWSVEDENSAFLGEFPGTPQ